jgi:hypothetical protein
VKRLDVPYRSQWDTDAHRYPADCGPTCVAMVLNYMGVAITPDRVYDFIEFYNAPDTDKQARRGVTYVSELMKVIRDHQEGVNYYRYNDRSDALSSLQANIDAGNTVIALVKYAPWRMATGNHYDFGHFVVVTGYDDNNIYINDPLFGLWVNRSAGAHYALSHDLFCAGWGGFVGNENPNWACFVTNGAAAPRPAPAPAATPVPAAPPAPVPDTPVETMADVNRRIRALAAYRWAEPPDFNNPATVQLWQEHLGDWGLHNDEYVVQPGDSLSALAQRYYGQAHRWRAIRAYNNLERDGLWVGERILIPQLGTTNAHNNPMLPSDTVGFSKAVGIGDLADPDVTAFDYNEIASASVGIGFVE